ncbi:MAG TPA: type II toxin-antitoxin system HicB family antitoxin [Woeseiaceae bacterium]|nr:type II toxin-antitoxin system HicB family antitoxin [Woeseiaceae bacterium]
MLKYKGYEGTAEVDMSRGVCRGKILFINDLVTYEAATPGDLGREFESAVDNYLETCVALGREPAKPFKGLFNVRVSPEVHRAAALRAAEDGISLNDVVVKALDAYLCPAAPGSSRSVRLRRVTPQ